MAMNLNLVEYGIGAESSDIRIHVCPKVQRLYVFRTRDARRVLAQVQPLRRAYQAVRGVPVVTALGYAVAWQRIPNCIQVPLRAELWANHHIDAAMSEGQKGQIAEQLVLAALRLGVVPLPVEAEAAETWDEQLSGIDLIVPHTTLQVKCDYRGGARELGGTGNLFLQLCEYNPHKQR